MRKNKRKVPSKKSCLADIEGDEKKQKCDKERGSKSSGPWATQLDDYNYRLLDATKKAESGPSSFDFVHRKKNDAQSDVRFVKWERLQTKEEQVQRRAEKYDKPLGRSIDRKRQLQRTSSRRPSRGAHWQSASPSFLFHLLPLVLLCHWNTVAYGKSTC